MSTAVQSFASIQSLSAANYSSSSTFSRKPCLSALSASDVSFFLDGVYGSDQRECVSTAKTVSQCKLDDTIFAEANSSARYGEVADDGMEKALDEDHLNANKASSMVDFGSGVGRQILYAFFRFPNLQYLLAAELSPSRSAIGFAALKRLASLLPSMETFENVKLISSCCSTKSSEGDQGPNVQLNDFLRLECTQLYGGVRLFRSVEFRCCDFFELSWEFLCESSVIFLQLDFERRRYGNVCEFIQKHFPAGSRLLSYRSMEFIFLESGFEKSMPLNRMKVNGTQTASDTFKTSWAEQHQFYLYDVIEKKQ